MIGGVGYPVSMLRYLRRANRTECHCTGGALSEPGAVWCCKHGYWWHQPPKAPFRWRAISTRRAHKILRERMLSDITALERTPSPWRKWLR